MRGRSANRVPEADASDSAGLCRRAAGRATFSRGLATFDRTVSDVDEKNHATDRTRLPTEQQPKAAPVKNTARFLGLVALGLVVSACSGAGEDGPLPFPEEVAEGSLSAKLEAATGAHWFVHADETTKTPFLYIALDEGRPVLASSNDPPRPWPFSSRSPRTLASTPPSSARSEPEYSRQSRRAPFRPFGTSNVCPAPRSRCSMASSSSV